MNTTKTIMIMFFCMITLTIFAQGVGINSSNADPDASAILDISSTNKGILVPRVSIGAIGASSPVSSPATGLLVWNTNSSISGGNGIGFYYWNGSQWKYLSSIDSRNTLDQAYDMGGSGAGRSVSADAGTFEVLGTDGFLVQGINGSGIAVGASGGIPAGAGSRMFYYPKKSAFRAGYVAGTQWDDSNIGDYSVALGSNVTASGYYSFAAASGTASGIQSVCIGGGTASGHLSVAIGSGTPVSSGQYSVALGSQIEAYSAFETVIGHYSTGYTPSSTTTIFPTDRLFVVGNGTSNSSRYNALTLWKNGQMQIGGDETSSDARRGRLTILGSNTGASVGTYNYITNSSASVQSGSGPTGALSLYADGAIAGTQVWAHSDKRIKGNISDTDNSSDLNTLLNLRIRDYEFLDKVNYGTGTQKKIIAQELKSVYPQAVDDSHTKIVPNIMQFSYVEDGWVLLKEHNLSQGDKVRLILDSGSRDFIVQEVSTEKIKVDCPNYDQILVYGQEVDDFHIVDYDALTTLTISAVQAQQNIINKLQKELQISKDETDTLAKEVASIKAALREIGIDPTIQIEH